MPHSLLHSGAAAGLLISAAFCLLPPAKATADTASLQVWYSSKYNDNDVTATSAEASQAEALGYSAYSPANGIINTSTGNGLVPLFRYLKANDTHRDTLLVASADGIAFAKANSYKLVATDGYVLTSNNTCGIRCPPLEQWYGAARDDHFLIDILGFDFYGGHNYQYGGADTWYPSWAADGNLYTPWTDGHVQDDRTGATISSGSGGHGPGGHGPSTTGYATIIGDDPSNLTVTDVGTFTSNTSPYQGRYPCGSFVYKGTWWYGTYTLDNPSFPPNPEPNCGNWCVQGPFVDFRYSTDFGKTWTEPRGNMTSDTDNLFGETAKNNSKVKFGAPHVVDFGQELANSPDGKMYIIGHGAVRPAAHQSWMQGDQVYVARVEPTVEAIGDKENWEFLTSLDPSGQAVWARGNPAKSVPLFTWNNHTGVVTMTYFAPLKKYIVCVSTPTFSPYTTKTHRGSAAHAMQQFDTYFLESDAPAGPFKMITYMREFGPEAYFVHYPSKFLDKSVEYLGDNGSAPVFNGYLSYSANFAFREGANPPGSGYHWSLQQMRFTLGSRYHREMNDV